MERRLQIVNIYYSYMHCMIYISLLLKCLLKITQTLGPQFKVIDLGKLSLVVVDVCVCVLNI